MLSKYFTPPPNEQIYTPNYVSLMYSVTYRLFFTQRKLIVS